VKQLPQDAHNVKTAGATPVAAIFIFRTVGKFAMTKNITISNAPADAQPDPAQI